MKAMCIWPVKAAVTALPGTFAHLKCKLPKWRFVFDVSRFGPTTQPANPEPATRPTRTTFDQAGTTADVPPPYLTLRASD